jgi:hypothetical protein
MVLVSLKIPARSKIRRSGHLSFDCKRFAVSPSVPRSGVVPEPAAFSSVTFVTHIDVEGE